MSCKTFCLSLSLDPPREVLISWMVVIYDKKGSGGCENTYLASILIIGSWTWNSFSGLT